MPRRKKVTEVENDTLNESNEKVTEEVVEETTESPEVKEGEVPETQEEVASEVVEDSNNETTEISDNETNSGENSTDSDHNLSSIRKERSTSSTDLVKGDRVVFKSTAKTWTNGQLIPDWIKQKTLYVRSAPSNGKCVVSPLKVGETPGVAYTRDLIKK